MKSRLGDLVKIKTGKLDANAASENGAYPFFTCSKEPLQIATFSYDCECVLVAGNGDLNVKYYSGKFDAYQRTYILETKDGNRLDVKYLFHFMSEYITTLRELSIGGVIKYIKLNNLTDVAIPLPPLATQRRIAEILDKADALRQKDQALLRKYDELAQAVFVDMFGDPVRNEKGWEVKPIRSTALVFSDGPFGSNLKSSHYADYGVRVIRLQNIGIGVFNDDENDRSYVSTNHYENVLKKHTCLSGDVIIGTMGNPNLRACILPIHIKKAINKADCILYRPNRSLIKPEFAKSLLNLPSTLGAVSHMMHGQTRTRISMGQLATLGIPVPPIQLQEKYEKIILNIQNHLKLISLNHSSSLFQSLLQKAFTGELVE